MDSMMKITYGMYLLSAKDEKDNACITNTLTQISSEPTCVSISVNKANYTTEMIKKTGKFTVSILTKDTPFSIFERFGYQSGRDVDKFADFQDVNREENGILSLTKYTNAVINAKVVKTEDMGSHVLFIAEVESSRKISDDESVSYEYYSKNIKPAPKSDKKKGFVCKICNFVYEGETLPADYICPICKHGAIDFEPLN